MEDTNLPSQEAVTENEAGLSHHICLIYGDDEERFRSLIPWIGEGLRAGDRVVYLSHDQDPDDLSRRLRDATGSLPARMADATSNAPWLAEAKAIETFVFARMRDVSFEGERFHVDRLLSFIAHQEEIARNGECASVRLALDMGWLREGEENPVRLIETRIHSDDRIELPVILLFQYDRRRFSPAFLLEALRAHPYITSNNLLCRNPFHIPSEEFLHPGDGSLQLARIIKTVLDLEQTKRERQHRIDQETVIAEISSMLLADPAGFETGIPGSLKTIGQFTGVDRCCLFRFSDDLKQMGCTDEWCSDSVDSLRARLRTIPTLPLEWWIEQLSLLKPIQIVRLPDLPAEAKDLREMLEQLGIVSLLGIPLHSGGRLIGFLGFDSVFHELRWNDDTMRLLDVLGGILSGVLERQRITDELIRLNYDLENRVHEEMGRRRMQENLLIQHSKLTAMGEMMVSLSHHWRQPLNALAIYIQDLKEARDFGELSSEYLDQIIEKSMREINLMSATIDDFKKFFHPDTGKVLYDVADSVRKAVSVIAAELESLDIHCSVTDSSVEQLVGFPGEFQQVILNILYNAREAILERRKRGERSDRDFIYIHIEQRDQTILVSIQDNGCGIPGDILDRIFNPFFTTKEPGQGTGMNLYINKMIIEKNMGGHIRAESEGPMRGARFVVELPAPTFQTKEGT